MPPQVFCFFLQCYKICASHLVVIVVQSSSPLIQTFCLEELYVRSLKAFSEANTFIQLIQKDISCPGIGQDEILNFQIFKKWVFILPTPFILIIYPVSSLEKITLFMGTATFNKHTALLRFMYQEEGQVSRVRLSVYFKLQLI